MTHVLAYFLYLCCFFASSVAFLFLSAVTCFSDHSACVRKAWLGSLFVIILLYQTKGLQAGPMFNLNPAPIDLQVVKNRL